MYRLVTIIFGMISHPHSAIHRLLPWSTARWFPRFPAPHSAAVCAKNGLFRVFVPKGASIERFTDEDILAAADELNGRPRRKLGYLSPEELFEVFLDFVYAA